MIIELFGPPACGKTTFAHALAARLRERGYAAQLIVSYRPAEQSSPFAACMRVPGRYGAVVRRLSRPLTELLAIARHPSEFSQSIGTVAGVMKTLPPQKPVLAIKLSQYLLRLSHSWSHISPACDITLFDQAFVQAVCFFGLFGRSPDDTLIARALDFLPKSDLLIRLDAPPNLLTLRLKDRKRRQSLIERWLELDVKTNLDSIRMIDRVHRLLLERGQLVICASSLDQPLLRQSVEYVTDTLMVMFRSNHMAAAS